MDILCFFLSCVCYAFVRGLFICALWSPAGKELTTWLSFVMLTVRMSLFDWYPGSGIVRPNKRRWAVLS